jgi:hypothetical protein
MMCVGNPDHCNSLEMGTASGLRRILSLRHPWTALLTWRDTGSILSDLDPWLEPKRVRSAVTEWRRTRCEGGVFGAKTRSSSIAEHESLNQ